MTADVIHNAPFSKPHQLNRDTMGNLAVRHSIENTTPGWDECIARDLQTHTLDELYPYLWLVARKEAVHVDPLHKHLVHKRTIIPAEDPKLHLVRYYETLYVKPLPDYLLNHSIWQEHIRKPVTQSGPQDQARYDKYRTAVGFLRSYGFLIRHESDFIIAQKANLLPRYISFQRFQAFIQPFHLMSDDQVSHRYQYGQFRLTRLNWAVRIVSIILLLKPGSRNSLFAWNYQTLYWQSSEYFQRYAAPFLFLFIFLSLILSAMQVGLAARADDAGGAFVRFSWGFSVAAIVIASFPLAGVFVIICVILCLQGQFAVRKRWKARGNRIGQIA